MHTINETAQAISQALTNGVQTISGRVFRSRLYQIQQHEIPCVMIAFENETISRNEGSPVKPRILTRTQRYSIVGVQRLIDPENVEEALVELAGEIETSLSSIADENIHDVRVTGIDLQLSDEGESPVGYVRVSVETTTRTRDNNPSQQL